MTKEQKMWMDARHTLMEGKFPKMNGSHLKAVRKSVNMIAEVAKYAPIEGGTSRFRAPSSQDVLELYVQALQKALGERWLDWLWENLPNSGLKSYNDSGTKYVGIEGAAFIWEDGTVTCNDTLPALPRLEVV